MNGMSLSKIINLRVSPLEHGAYQQAAEEEGIALQLWIRRELGRRTLGIEQWEELEGKRLERRREAAAEARDVLAQKRAEAEAPEPPAASEPKGKVKRRG